MSNRLLDLEKSMRRSAKVPARAPGAAPKVVLKKGPKSAPAATPPAAPEAAHSAAAFGLRRAKLSRAAAAVNYTVPGIVSAIRQPSPNTCWATVTTIMMMWREQASMSIATAMGRVGPTWLAMFNADQGLLGSQKVALLTAAGLAHQAPQSLTVGGWEGLLRTYGPLWVTTDEDPTAGFAIHARVLTGIHGDGTDAGTMLDITDPGNGTAYRESFGTFRRKYQQEAIDSKAPLRIQIVHWPLDAGFNVARSMAVQQGAYAFSLSSQSFATVDRAEFEPRYDEANPRGAIARAPSSFAYGLDKPKKMTAADVRWTTDALSADYRHLSRAIDSTPFVLKGNVLARLVQLNRFALTSVEKKVVFALRGCTIDNDQRTFADSVSAREIVPNHIDNRCLIGVWDTTNDKIVAFQASTVPNWEYMEAYRQNHADKANMLPCGKYQMVVGTHRPMREDATGKLVDNPGRVQGALRNDAKIVVLRTENDLCYSVQDTWDSVVANDNIHPGIVGVNDGASTVPDYSSAGCNTIPGGSVRDTPSGAWADFRTALGLDNARPTKDDGRKVAYMLLTGREARLVASGKDADAPARLRFGSDGADVRALQDALSKHAKKYFTAKSDGEFGAGTAMAFIRYQKDRDGGAADGVVTPTDATALGFPLTVPAAGGAKQFGLGDLIPDPIRQIFKKIYDKVTARADEGRFVMTSDVGEVMHDDTPSMLQWSKKTANFALKAYAPGAGGKDLLRLDPATAKTHTFQFTLSFEYNGYDIREAQVQRRIQGSTELTSKAKIDIKFVAKRATGSRAEVSRIDFLMNGKWDPGVGDKFIDFGGKVWLESDGDIGIELNQTPIAALAAADGKKFTDIKVEQFPPPKVDRKWKVIFFAVDKDIIIEQEMQLFKDWVRALEKENPVRWQRLQEGLIPVHIDGYASGTGPGDYNQKLSVKRKDKVKALLQQYVSNSIKLIERSLGEPDPGKKGKEHEKEDFAQRRVEVWFEVAI